MKVDHYSNRKDRRLLKRERGIALFGLNKPHIAPRVIIKRSHGPAAKEVTVIEKRTDKKRERVIGKEKKVD